MYWAGLSAIARLPLVEEGLSRFLARFGPACEPVLSGLEIS
jgi:hypothetical protein